MAKVLGLGYIPLDAWEGAADLPTSVGGSTANTLAMLARWGHLATLLGAVGRDAAGRQCLKDLADIGIDVSHVISRAGRKTKRIRIIVDEHGERAFHIARRNIAPAPKWDELHKRVTDPETFDCYHTALATRGSLEIARRSRWASYNGQRCYGRRAERNLHRELIEASQVVVMPAGYLAVVLGLYGRDAVRAGVLNAFERPVLRIVTLGGDGLVAWHRGRLFRMPALDLSTHGLRVRDTTGAGDAFHAGLLHRLLSTGRRPSAWRRRQVEEACRFGTQVAAYACTRFGTKNVLDEGAHQGMFGRAPGSVTVTPRTALFLPVSVRRPMCRGEG